MFSNSLSFAIKDLIAMSAQERAEAMVNLVIYSSTMVNTMGEEDLLLEAYKSSYWAANPELAERLYFQLKESNCLLQPRLHNLVCPLIAGDHTPIYESFEIFRDRLANNLEESHDLGWCHNIAKLPTKEEVRGAKNPLDLCTLYYQNQ